MRTLQIANGKTNVETPDGLSHDSGDIFNLTDDQFAKVAPGLFPTYLVDLGDLTPDRLGGSDLTEITLPAITLSAVANNSLYQTTAPFDGTILSARFYVTQAVTTAAKLATLTTEVAGTPTTGGAIALTSAAATPVGKVIESSVVSAGGAFTKGQLIGVKASSVTAFVEGAGLVVVLVSSTE